MNRFEKPDRIDVEAEHSRLAYDWIGTVVTAPSGPCPFALNDTSEHSVHLWVNKVINVGHDRGLHYAPSALRRFARYFYDFDTEEYRQVCEHITSSICGSVEDAEEQELHEELDELSREFREELVHLDTGLPKPDGYDELVEEQAKKKKKSQDDYLQPVIRKPTLGKVGRGLQKGEGKIELGGGDDDND